MDRSDANKRLLEYISLLDGQLSEQIQANDRLASRLVQLEESLGDCQHGEIDNASPNWPERYGKLVEAIEGSEREHQKVLKLQAATFRKKLSALEEKVSELQVQNEHLQKELDGLKMHAPSFQTVHSSDSIDKAYVLNSLNIILDPAKKEFHQETLLMLVKAVGGPSEARMAPNMWNQSNLSELWVAYLTASSDSK